MKNNLALILILTLCCLSNSTAQVKFIEVLVKDTIVLKPIAYIFGVSSGLNFEYDYENPNAQNEFSEKLRQSEEKIIALLNGWNYEFSISGDPDASFSIGPTDKTTYNVKIKDSVEKEEFKSRMKKEGINFSMSNIKYEDQEYKMEKTYARLLKKAKERAELIAQLSSKKLGEIIEISDSKPESSNIPGFLENLANLRSYGNMSMSLNFNTGILEKSLLVKYSID